MKAIAVGHLQMPVHVFVADTEAAILQWATDYCGSHNETSKQTLVMKLSYALSPASHTLFSPLNHDRSLQPRDRQLTFARDR